MRELWTLKLSLKIVTAQIYIYYFRVTSKRHHRVLMEPLVFEGRGKRKKMSKTGEHFIRSLLMRNPLERLGSRGGVGELKRHRFFLDIDFRSILSKTFDPPWIPDFEQSGEDETRFISKEFLGKRGSMVDPPPAFEACLYNEFEGFSWEYQLSPIEMTVRLPPPDNKANKYELSLESSSNSLL